MPGKNVPGFDRFLNYPGEVRALLRCLRGQLSRRSDQNRPGNEKNHRPGEVRKVRLLPGGLPSTIQGSHQDLPGE